MDWVTQSFFSRLVTLNDREGVCLSEQLWFSLFAAFVGNQHLLVRRPESARAGQGLSVAEQIEALLVHIVPAQYTVVRVVCGKDTSADEVRAALCLDDGCADDDGAVEARRAVVRRHTRARSLTRPVDIDAIHGGIADSRDERAGEPEARRRRYAQLVVLDRLDRASAGLREALVRMVANGKISGTQDSLPRPFVMVGVAREGRRVPLDLSDRFLLSHTLRPEFAFPLDASATLPVPYGHAFLEEVAQNVMEVHTEHEIKQYQKQLVFGLRNHPAVEAGAGPHALMALDLASRVAAALVGARAYVVPDDVSDVVWGTMCHRLRLRPDGEEDVFTIVEGVLHSVDVPC